jgi:hypothetical protein
MWEYNKIEFKYDSGEELTKELAKIGDCNWEIVNYIEERALVFGAGTKVTVIVKRTKETPKVI